jgi:hypothetical protein
VAWHLDDDAAGRWYARRGGGNEGRGATAGGAEWTTGGGALIAYGDNAMAAAKGKQHGAGRRCGWWRNKTFAYLRL